MKIKNVRIGVTGELISKHHYIIDPSVRISSFYYIPIVDKDRNVVGNAGNIRLEGKYILCDTEFDYKPPHTVGMLFQTYNNLFRISHLRRLNNVVCSLKEHMKNKKRKVTIIKRMNIIELQCLPIMSKIHKCLNKNVKKAISDNEMMKNKKYIDMERNNVRKIKTTV